MFQQLMEMESELGTWHYALVPLLNWSLWEILPFSFPWQLIFCKQYTEADGLCWHLKHFRCQSCDLLLAGQRYVAKDQRPFCMECHDTIYAQVNKRSFTCRWTHCLSVRKSVCLPIAWKSNGSQIRTQQQVKLASNVMIWKWNLSSKQWSCPCNTHAHVRRVICTLHNCFIFRFVTRAKIKWLQLRSVLTTTRSRGTRRQNVSGVAIVKQHLSARNLCAKTGEFMLWLFESFGFYYADLNWAGAVTKTLYQKRQLGRKTLPTDWAFAPTYRQIDS